MHVPTLSLRKAAAVAAAALCGLAVSAGPAGATDGWKHNPFDYYLALGDSLGAGWQPNATTGQGYISGRGYADDIAASLKAGGTKYVNLACPGETTGSMIHGGCPYPEPYQNQLDAAADFLKAHKGDRVLVTLDIGANDVDGCAGPGGLDVQCGLNGIKQTAQDLPVIVDKLRAAAGHKTEFVGSTYYNPFLASWLTGSSGQSNAELSAVFLNLFNAVFSVEYPLHGVRVADVGAAFSSNDFVHQVQIAPGVTVPLNVARICQWTWMCAPKPVGPNIHANDAGYKVMAKAFEDVI
ncbi:MAG: SGNH/GDSL hydrolase family protein [Catenulispora sp.]|nr:SGNH/GDSL hydrolase family protein [Catenulispora sp.]